MEGPLKKIKLDTENLSGVHREDDSIGSEAVANDLVMEEVLKHLPDKEAVKNFRFLSRKCSELGFAALVKGKPGCDHLKAALELTPSLDTKEIEYLRAYGSQFKRVTMKLGNFTQDCGKCDGKNGLKMLRELLVERLTGMEELEVRLAAETQHRSYSTSSKSSFQSSDIFGKGDTLPNLKAVRLCLSFECSYMSFVPHVVLANKTMFQRQLKVVGQILRISPNLQEITGLDQGFLRELEKTGRWPLVKTLDISKLDQLNMRDNSSKVVAKFAKAEPKLEELKTRGDDQRQVEKKNLFALLKSSEESLEKLEVNTGRGTKVRTLFVAEHENYQKTPLCLKRLQSITMGTIIDLLKLVGPRRVVGTLPNLQNVIMDRSESSNDGGLRAVDIMLGVIVGDAVDLDEDDDVIVIEEQAPNNIVQVTDLVFESVNSIHLEYFSSKLTTMFPNLQTVKICLLMNDLRGAPKNTLWRLPTTVENVELYHFNLKLTANHGIDALLTGIPANVCQDLIAKWKSNKNELKNLNPGDFREMSSVVNLPKLKSLQFNCVDPTLRPSDLSTISGAHISYIARWGALDQLPDLRLHFRISYSIIGLKDLPQVARFLEPVKDIATVAFDFDRYKR